MLDAARTAIKFLNETMCMAVFEPTIYAAWVAPSPGTF